MTGVIDHLEFRARLEPDAPALQSVQTQLSFQRLHKLVKKFAAALRAAGVQPGQVVVTALPYREIDWIVTLALIHEGATTCSTQAHSGVGSAFRHDWVVTDAAEPKLAGPRTIRIDNAWIAAARAGRGNIERRDQASANGIERIFLTSGTTGKQKAVALTLEQLLGRAVINMGMRGPYNAITMMGQASGAGFGVSLGSLMAGAPVYCARATPEVVDCIRKFSINALHGSPAQIAALLKEVAAGEPLRSIRSVRSAGASPSQSLVRAIHTHLTSNYLSLYGSTEAGGICAHRPMPDSDPAVTGFLQPGARLEIVDAAGLPVKAGEEGYVRARTPHLANGYMGNPEATARSFRDGWFYPGDRGRWNGSGQLELAGRDSELINAGGVKVDPVPIEQFLAGLPGIEEVAVFPVETAQGMQRLAAAVVGAAGLDFTNIQKAVRDKFGKARSPSLFIATPAIPRNEAGKVMRAKLGELYAAQLKSA